MNKTLRIGVLGCSNFGLRSMVPAIKALENKFKLVAISSRRIEKAKKNSKIFGIQHAFSSHQKLIDLEGLDAILIGPYDLSASLGLTAKFKDQSFLACMNTIKEKAENAKIACGIHIVKPIKSDLLANIENGYRFVAYSMDSIFMNTISINPINE